MKYIVYSLIFCCLLQYSCRPKNEVNDALKVSSKSLVDFVEPASTTIFLVRHAEKASGTDPILTKEGDSRAYKLASMLLPVSLDYIFSTDYNRTKQTALPIADAKQMSINIYDPSDLNGFSKDIKANFNQKNILIVGHSNTTPTLTNLLMEQEIYPAYDESEYDNLIIVNIPSQGGVKSQKILMSDF